MELLRSDERLQFIVCPPSPFRAAALCDAARVHTT